MDLKSKAAAVLLGGSLLAWSATGAYAQTWEAESGALFGNASLYSDPEASGGGGVAYISSPNAGFRISNAPAASAVDLRYASENPGALSVFVDGAYAGAIHAPASGAWVGSYRRVFFSVEIPAGSDFEIRFLSGDAAMNVDSVDFIPPVTHAVEAESGTLLGNASVYSDPAASGGQGVAYISSPGAGFRLQRAPAASGVEIRYASMQSGTVSVFVNGDFAGKVDFAPTGGWVDDYGRVSFETNIPSGANFELRFRQGDAAMNVDRVVFVAPQPSLPQPEPVPEPAPQPRGHAFGIDASGNLFHADEGWSAAFHYLCANGTCFPGTRSDGFFRRDASGEIALGETARIEFKVEDNGGQCLTGEVIVTRQPGLTAVESPCASERLVEMEPDPDPLVITNPEPEPASEANPHPSDPTSDNGQNDRGAGQISVAGDTITTRFAERFRDRHESDRSHDTYIGEYAEGSTYEIVLIDRPNSLEVQIHSPQTPLTMVNLTHDHIINPGFADPPQYRSGGFMAKGSLDGPADDSAAHRSTRFYFEIHETNGRPWHEVRNAHEIATLEFTPRRELDGNFPQYYSDIFRYRAGQGGITFERGDARYFSAGPTTNFAHGSPGFEFSQPYLGITQPELHRFTLGRELFRADFTGDPLPGNGGQATGAAPNAAASSCLDCHFRLGKAAPPGRGSQAQQGFIHSGKDLRVAPSLIGLGLLEAVDPRAIEEQARQSGGKIPDGRFGWKATQSTIRDQIAMAFETDLGVQGVSDVFIDRLEEYVRGLGVPMRRHPSAAANQEPNVGLRVPDAHSITDPDVLDGEAAFAQAACDTCHAPTLQTGDLHPVSQFRNITIRPFTDLLLWDMGPELCAETSAGNTDRCEWRTAPLWGLRLQEAVTGHATYLHDGRATTVDQAIRLHDGDARRSRQAYENLSNTRRRNLLLYLDSL